MANGAEDPVVVDRVSTPRGELVLRRAGSHLEVISNGTFLMDTRDGRSERLLVTSALDAHPSPARLLIGGLGVGFSLLAAVESPPLERIDVVEIEPAVVRWHREHLAHLTGDALADPRVSVLVGDLRHHLSSVAASSFRYDVLALDVDNGPDWTVTDANTALYAEAGIALMVDCLGPGGVLAVWSASAVPEFESRLREQLTGVRVLEVPVRAARAHPDIVYLGVAPALPGSGPS